MNSEERKAYNKKYYTEHKAKIQQQWNNKVKCSKCLRMVSQNYMNTHENSEICKRKCMKHLESLMMLQNMLNKNPATKIGDSDSNIQNILTLAKKLKESNPIEVIDDMKQLIK